MRGVDMSMVMTDGNIHDNIADTYKGRMWATLLSAK